MDWDSGPGLPGFSGSGSLRGSTWKDVFPNSLTWLWAEFSPSCAAGQKLSQVPCLIDPSMEQLATWQVAWWCWADEKEAENAVFFQNERLPSLFSRTMGWREQSQRRVRGLQWFVARGFLLKALSGYRAGGFVAQVRGEGKGARWDVPGTSLALATKTAGDQRCDSATSLVHGWKIVGIIVGASLQQRDSF